MVLVDAIQHRNEKRSEQSQTFIFLILPQYGGDGLVDLPKLVSVISDQEPVEHISTYGVADLVDSDRYGADDRAEVSEGLIPSTSSRRKKKSN